jgi:hypothetical protein
MFMSRTGEQSPRAWSQIPHVLPMVIPTQPPRGRPGAGNEK